MGHLVTSVGTFSSTGAVKKYVELDTLPTKGYFAIIGKEGGTSVRSGCVGFGDNNSEWVAAYGQSGAHTNTEWLTTRCLRFWEYYTSGTRKFLVSASFEGFSDELLAAHGLITMNFDVQKADANYSYIARLEN